MQKQQEQKLPRKSKYERVLNERVNRIATVPIKISRFHQ